MAADDPLRTMLEQASRTLSAAGQKTSDATAHAQQVLEQLQALSTKVDHYALYLLPLCLALLILHEHYRSLTDGRAFRIGQVLGRCAAVVAAVIAYPQLCGLICRIGGAGSGWMTATNYLDTYDVGTDSLSTAWDQMGGLSQVPKLIGMFIVWIVLMISVLFAYVAGALLSTIQAVSLSIFLGLGKVCIVVSLIPGVGLAKSWARSLAQVAAWSTVAGVITKLLAMKNVSIGHFIVAGEFVELLKVSAHFIILALTTLAVPIITAKLFSGGAAGLSEVMPGFLAMRGAAAAVSQRFGGHQKTAAAASASSGGANAAQAAGPRRVHKLALADASTPPFARLAASGATPRRRMQRLPIASGESASEAKAPRRDTVLDSTAPPRPTAPRADASIERTHREDTYPDNVIDLTGETA